MGFNFRMAFDAALMDATSAARYAGGTIEQWIRATLEANETALHGIAEAVASQEIAQETAEQLFRLHEAMIRDEAALGEVTVTAQAAVSTFFASLLAALKKGPKLGPS